MGIMVDTYQIVKNIRQIKKVTNRDIMAVIKSDAYGLGQTTILKILLSSNIKWIVYNTYDEYIIDKDLLVEANCNVLILESPNRKMITDDYHNLYLSINSYEDVFIIQETKIKVHLHLRVNTGMNRLGLMSVNECKKVIDKVKNNSLISIDGLYTHFASNENENSYYMHQLKEFKKYLKIYPFKQIHSAATPSLHKEIVGNYVRVGLSLYGYGNHHIKLYPAVTYISKVIASFRVKKNESVGYDMKYVPENNEYINVVPIGYNDISGISHVNIKNKRYPLVGKMCMNHCFFTSQVKINKISKLIVLSKNDIIDSNWYLILTSLRKAPKNYIMRGYYDLPTISKRAKTKNQRYILRRRGNKTFNTRIVRT